MEGHQAQVHGAGRGRRVEQQHHTIRANATQGDFVGLEDGRCILKVYSTDAKYESTQV